MTPQTVRPSASGTSRADVPALVERPHGLSAVQLPAVIDLAEWMDAATL